MAKVYAHYFLDQDSPATMTSYINYDPKTSHRLRYMDDKVVEGCEFGCDNIWLKVEGPAERKIMDANTQSYDRFFGFYAYNYENIRDLCGELEVYIGGEKHLIKKSGAIFIPGGLEVGPMVFRNITRPIFFTIEFPCGEGLNKKYD